MYRQSLFDSFFSPPVVVVVSEERLKAAEKEAKTGQLQALDAVSYTHLTLPTKA